MATRLLADIHPFVELGDWLTLFEWAFREDTRIRAEACFLVSSNFVYVLEMPMKFGHALPVIFWPSPDCKLDGHYASVHPLQFGKDCLP